MGWRVVGRVPLAVRPQGIGPALRIARGRPAADKWSVATSAGDPAPDVLADTALDDLLASAPRPSTGISTRRDADHLRWRYRFPQLRYRALTGPGGIRDGVAIFRVRARGSATETVLCELLAPAGDRRRITSLVRAVANAAGGDYLIASGVAPASAALAARLVRVPRQGPILTWRDVNLSATCPPMADWHLSLGDVELF
jgi:hypothetical protein